MTKISEVVFIAEISIMTVFWFYVMWPRIRARFLNARARRDDKDWAYVNDYLDVVHRLFGNSVKLLSTIARDGTREISLVCRKCGRENRIKARFRGAACGACHTSLVITPGREAEERISN
jgi:hypothetical protein